MPINLLKFFTPAYLFELQPSISHNAIIGLSIFFGLFVLAAVVLNIYRKVKKLDNLLGQLFSKYEKMTWLIGLIGLVYIFIRYERAYFLSGRFWIIIILAILGVKLYNILKFQRKTIPSFRKAMEEKKNFDKYLPKRKN
ncbi:MAG: hypothetical protein WCL61_00945 [bacterium]